jgi:hypothetical protein
MLGFTLARLSYLNVSGSAATSFATRASPGEWYHYHTGIYRIGITLHLGACLPAGFLMVWQFVPVIRYKALLFHRINGYLVILLVLVSNAGCIMIAKKAFDGGVETQTIVGALVILTTVSVAMSYYNIKRLQIDQHRVWMLRAMFYMASIITNRLIMALSAIVTSQIGDYYQIQTCGEVAFVLDSWKNVTDWYPECASGGNETNIIVHADLNGRPEQLGASLGLSFGTALWLALLIHLIGVELYLGLTPREGERLRRVSYQKQLEAGLNNPGSSGLTADRWGDADEWAPEEPESRQLNCRDRLDSR